MLENIYQKYDVVISDTSSLSNLNNIHKLHLLKDLYNTITITPKILEEYSVRFKEKLPDWITVKDVKKPAPQADRPSRIARQRGLNRRIFWRG